MGHLAAEHGLQIQSVALDTIFLAVVSPGEHDVVTVTPDRDVELRQDETDPTTQITIRRGTEWSTRSTPRVRGTMAKWRYSPGDTAFFLRVGNGTSNAVLTWE